jgi:hypothetical protein
LDSTYKTVEWTPAAAGRYIRLQATSANGSAVVINEIAVGGRTHTPTTTPVFAASRAALLPLSMNRVPEKIISIRGFCPLKVPTSPVYVYDMAGRTLKRAAMDGSFPYIKRDGVFVFKTDQ